MALDRWQSVTMRTKPSLSSIHLGPRLYATLQVFVHRGHTSTFEILRDLLRLQPGETVVEVGCGTGILAAHFIEHGYDYWGVDLDVERVATAQRCARGGHFLVGNAADLPALPLPRFQRAFIHGVIHHLDGVLATQLLEQILSLDPHMRLAIIEPYRPVHWRDNPLGALFANLDEGKFVLTFDAWRALFGPSLDVCYSRSLKPRWPVDFIVARLNGAPIE